MAVQTESYAAEDTGVASSAVVPIAASAEGCGTEVDFSGRMCLLFHVAVRDGGETSVDMALSPLEVTGGSANLGILSHLLASPVTSFDFEVAPPLEFDVAFTLSVVGRCLPDDLLLCETVHVKVNGDGTAEVAPVSTSLRADPRRQLLIPHGASQRSTGSSA